MLSKMVWPDQVLPTPKLAATSLLSPEFFVQIGPSSQNVFMIFLITDIQMNTPVPYPGTGVNVLYPVFFYRFTHYVCSLCFDQDKRCW